MKRILLLVFFQLLISYCFSQGNNGGGIVDPDEILFSNLEMENYFINKEKDTVFYFVTRNDSIISHRFFIKENDNWILFYDNGRPMEKGSFKKEKNGLFLPIRLLLSHHKYFLKKRKYLPVKKVGKWRYFSKNGDLKEEINHDKK